MSSINLSRSSLRLFCNTTWKTDDSFSSLKHPWCICTLSRHLLSTKQPITLQFSNDSFCDTQWCSLTSCPLPPLGLKVSFVLLWFFVSGVSIAALSSCFLYTALGFGGCTMPRSVRASAWHTPWCKVVMPPSGHTSQCICLFPPVGHHCLTQQLVIYLHILSWEANTSHLPFLTPFCTLTYSYFYTFVSDAELLKSIKPNTLCGSSNSMAPANTMNTSSPPLFRLAHKALSTTGISQGRGCMPRDRQGDGSMLPVLPLPHLQTCSIHHPTALAHMLYPYIQYTSGTRAVQSIGCLALKTQQVLQCISKLWFISSTLPWTLQNAFMKQLKKNPNARLILAKTLGQPLEVWELLPGLEDIP